MYSRIQNTFEKIHAEESLKNNTRAFLAQRIQDASSRPRLKYLRSLAALACLLLVLIGWGGYHLCFTPTTAISIDINPSIELEVNRFDRVIEVKGYNQDGMELAASLEIRFMHYLQAVEQVLENEKIAQLLAQEEEMSIAVVGDDATQCGRILSGIQTCTAGQRNAYCYHMPSSEAATAHEMGLSYGKYRAWVTLRSLDPSVTAEEIQNMTMRQIRDRINALSGEEGQNGQPGHGNKEMGGGHGYGKNE